MKKKKGAWIIGGALLLALGMLVPPFMPTGPVCIGAVPFLGDRHKNSGLACDGCHAENPPKQNVPPGACIRCHGDAAKMSEVTKKADPNPHQAPHFEIGDCTSCHHAHRASEDQCAGCHRFGFTVP